MKDITKTVADSFSVSSKLLFPKHMNNEGILYGGQHLMWIDELAGIVENVIVGMKNRGLLQHV